MPTRPTHRSTSRPAGIPWLLLLALLWTGLRLAAPAFAAAAAADEALPAPHEEIRFREAVTLLQSDADVDKTKAVKLLKELAVDGHARSQRVLGVLYLNGLGVIRNEKQALRWFEMAAENHYPIAMLSYAEMLVEGVDGEQDYERARPILEELVAPASNFNVSPEEFGDFRVARARAHYLLGLIYSNGWGTEADKPRAIELFEKAARGGERDATMYLAIAYAKGEDVEKSVPKAKEYFELLNLQSADALNREIESMFAGSSDAMDQRNMEEASEQAGAAVTTSILAMQTEFAKEVLDSKSEDFDAEMAASLLQLASDGGYAEAKLQLGILRYRGLGGERDEAAAAKLFREAADQGWILALYDLAALIEKGVTTETEKNERTTLLKKAADEGLYAAQALLDGDIETVDILSPDEARDLCLSKADEGDPRALYSLARRKVAGWGVDQETDVKAIADLYERSAKSGYARAQYELGIMRFLGQGVPRDPMSGFSWLRSAAFQEYPPALYFMGNCYAQGLGVEPDFAAAFRYFTKSADLGFDKAKNSLAVFYNTGIYVTRNEWKATELYLEAADEGDPQAAQNIGNCYLLGRGAKRDVKEGLRWLGISAEHGNARAAFQLASIYSEGLLVDKDPVEHAYWIERLAEFGDRGAMKETALNYFYGRGKPRNRGKAYSWIQTYMGLPGAATPSDMYLEGEYEDYNALKRLAPKDYSAMIISADLLAQKGWTGSNPKAAAATLSDLAAKGFSGARLRLAKLYLDQDFSGANPRKAMSLLKGLYDQHRNSRNPGEIPFASEAAFLLCRCYEEGLGVKADAKRGLDWLESSATLGYPKAQYKLGARYVAGEGVSKDVNKGAQWLVQAAKGGDGSSRLQIARLNLVSPLGLVSETDIVDWLKELVDQGSGEARILLRRYGVKYKELEYEERESPTEPDAEPDYDPWAPVDIG